MSVCSLIFSIYKPYIGAMSYLVYMYLAPYIYIGGYIIYARTIAFFFLFLYLLKFRKIVKKRDYKPLSPFLLLLLGQFCLLFTSEIFEYSFNRWLFTVSFFCFALFLFGIIKSKPKTGKYFSITLFTVFCLITGYGLYLTTMPGINPYLMFVNPVFGIEFNEAYAAGNSGLSTSTDLIEGRLFGRISSVFNHPMAYGLNLGFFFIYCLYFLRKKPKVMIVVLVCIFAAILVSGVRTPIGALGVTGLFIILYLRKFKYFIFGLIAFVVAIFGTELISAEAGEYMASIISSDDSETRGSSISMRLEQLEGCIQIVKDNFLTGKGYGWSNWYNETRGTHPKALWFESILFTVLVNTGILGMILWGFVIIGYYKYIVVKIKDTYTRAIFLALFLYYLVYSLITGDFGINYFLIFYVVLLGITPKIFQRQRARSKAIKQQRLIHGK